MSKITKKSTKKKASKKKTSKKMGRPRIEFDDTHWANFKKLCTMQATLVEIAAFFEVSEDTIERRVKETYGVTFAEHYKSMSGSGKISLRRKQMDVALSGNVSMLIWLGKQYLGQTDKSVNETHITSDLADKVAKARSRAKKLKD